MNTLCPNAILQSTPSKTVAIDSNSLTTNVAVPCLIKWEERNFLTEWTDPNVVPPQAITNSK